MESKNVVYRFIKQKRFDINIESQEQGNFLIKLYTYDLVTKEDLFNNLVCVDKKFFIRRKNLELLKEYNRELHDILALSYSIQIR